AAAPNNKFSGTELVTVLAGGNDVIMYSGAVTAGKISPDQAQALMGQAGTELATYVKDLILANGATHVLVVNLPDVSKTPRGLAAGPQAQALLNAMVVAYNTKLAEGLNGVGGVLL